MFMFRSKRTALAKRLWKARIRRENEAGGEAERDDVNENRDPRDFANADERSLRTKLLKRLKESQLETLAFAVENGESSMSTCVMLPKDLVEEPHLKCCQTWRWPDLRQPQELKQLPLCDSIKDPAYICCNPYHWSRICKPASRSTVPPQWSVAQVLLGTKHGRVNQRYFYEWRGDRSRSTLADVSCFSFVAPRKTTLGINNLRTYRNRLRRYGFAFLSYLGSVASTIARRDYGYTGLRGGQHIQTKHRLG
ncbi:Mothers against decapentaplegic 7 [Homalodisca vitripennis]|nr:Mothers against decapentaplegic 7 [Homalodisca vitripennis]